MDNLLQQQNETYKLYLLINTYIQFYLKKYWNVGY